MVSFQTNGGEQNRARSALWAASRAVISASVNPEGGREPAGATGAATGGGGGGATGAATGGGGGATGAATGGGATGAATGGGATGAATGGGEGVAEQTLEYGWQTICPLKLDKVLVSPGLQVTCP